MGRASLAAGLERHKSLLLALLATLVLLMFVLVAYEQARAQVPQHRAALERLVRAQTGLNIRFGELALHWGWYGPEIILQRVELDQPGAAVVLLRAPQLVVGFDAWRTLRSGHPELGRIELIAPDIDLQKATAAGQRGPPARGAAAITAGTAPEVLQRWRSGRIDIEGGTVRLPQSDGAGAALLLQIRRASLRHTEDEWSGSGLVFLPDRIGRTARIVLRVSGDLSQPQRLSGSLRIDARRLLFAGCAALLTVPSAWTAYLPTGGGGDVSVDAAFEQGVLLKASGSVRAGDVVFAPSGAAGAGEAAAAGGALHLERLRADWQVVQRGADWQLSVQPLQLARGTPPASLLLESHGGGASVHGELRRIPLQSALAVTHWLAPSFDLPDVELSGAGEHFGFDWDRSRAPGGRLRARGSFTQVSLTPHSHDFTLSGLNTAISGSEQAVDIQVTAPDAVLELAAAPQYPLQDVAVDSALHLSAQGDSWVLATDAFKLEHGRTRLQLAGIVRSGVTPSMTAHGTLSAMDVSLAERLLGVDTTAAFGAAASHLSSGEIRDAQFELHGPIESLPFAGHNAFSGTLVLRNAVLSGGGLWPDLERFAAHISWRDAHFQASVDGGQAGPFRIAAAAAEWDASGTGPTRLAGRISARVEDALAWLRSHPDLQRYAPGVSAVEARGAADVAINVNIPVAQTEAAPEARIVAQLSAVRLAAVDVLPPLEGVSGPVLFDAGHLQRSLLHGQWVGGPVTLQLGERREHNTRVLAVRAEGNFDAARLASTANLSGSAAGATRWAGDLTYTLAETPAGTRWRMRLQSDLQGVTSALPEPLGKQADTPLPAALDVSGDELSAQARLSIGDRVRGVLRLAHSPTGWKLGHGAVNFGTAMPALPADAVLLVQGRLGRLDLPAYALAWQQLRADLVPGVRADVLAGQLQLGARSYPEAHVSARRSPAGNELVVEAAGLAGVARWPAAGTAAMATRTLDTYTDIATATGMGAGPGAGPGPGTDADTVPALADIHLSRLELPDGSVPSEGLGLLAVLAPAAHLAIDEISWRRRSIGRLTANFVRQQHSARLVDLQLTNTTEDARGTLSCDLQSISCQLQFRLDSDDGLASLENFGFRPDVAASHAMLAGNLQWQPTSQGSWLASLRGTLNMELSDGRILRALASEGAAQPFVLLTVPALVSALERPDAGTPSSAITQASLAAGGHDLAFSRLQADFELREGQASTSNLHLDGDAEILIRGRTGLLARDYDQQVWLLGGKERLPEALRRLVATPRMAAVWLSLRDLVIGRDEDPRSHAVLRLQGSWDDPMVVAAR